MKGFVIVSVVVVAAICATVGLVDGAPGGKWSAADLSASISGGSLCVGLDEGAIVKFRRILNGETVPMDWTELLVLTVLCSAPICLLICCCTVCFGRSSNY